MEAALEALGAYLGLQTRRPDNELGTDPDVLWYSRRGLAVSVEAKTDKGEGAVYQKQDLGQRWIREHLDVTQIRWGFVGPAVPTSAGANPLTL